MRILATIIVLFSVPAGAADYSPWPGRDQDQAPARWVELAQQQGKSCCKRCTKGQPCGNSCISRKSTCKQPPGCAC